MIKDLEIPDKISNIIRNRIVLFLLLTLILTSLCIYYADNFMYHQKYPSIEIILNDYPEGEIVSVTGTVTQTIPDGFIMNTNYQDKTITFKVNSNETIFPGDQASVLGILESNYQISSQQIIITKKWDYINLLIRSFLAFLILLLFFNHYWKFNPDKWIFSRRKK